MSRSYLFVPGDSERKLAKAADSDADALILDLEDAVTPGNRAMARERIADFLASGHDIETSGCGSTRSTRPMHSRTCARRHAGRARGIVLPKPTGAHDANQLAQLLDTLETEHGLSPGQTRILPIATERPGALFRMHEYAEATPRIAGPDLGRRGPRGGDRGVAANRDDAGNWLPDI